MTPTTPPHPAAHTAERPGEHAPGPAARAAVRAARLESLLGDPLQPTNAHGIAALIAADDLRRPPATTERLLSDNGLGAEFVPAELGGHLTRADLLAKVLRPIFRRDLALGFGFGITSLFATAAIWAAGSPRQREQAAGLLLGGGRASIVHHELAHANAILRDEFTARPAPGGGHVLDGRKDVVMNAARSGAYVVYARTSPERGPRSHSVFLLHPGDLPQGAVHHLPRLRTPGMRGGLFSGLQFTQCPAPQGAMVGHPGEGVSLALRTFQVNRCLIPAVAISSVATVLHSAVHAATAGRSTVARRCHKALTGVFADLLACDAMATVALRSLSLLPRHTHVLAAAVKYVVPDLLREDLEELAAVLGAHGYEHGSPQYGALEKIVRDLPVAGLGHAGTAACQAVIVPQLRTLAQRSWFRTQEPPPGLFRPEEDLPDLDYRLLGFAGGDDFLPATLVAGAQRLSTHRTGTAAALGELARLFVGELQELTAACAALPAAGAALGDPAIVALSDRYALILAAAAVLGIWEAQAQEGTDPFLTDPAWAVLALTRLASRLGAAAPELPDGCTQDLLTEVLARHRSGRSYDLDGTSPTR